MLIVYVTRDRERAEGLEEGPDYIIFSNKKGEHLDTLELLQTEEASQLLSPNSQLLVFKNTKQIEELASKNKWNLLNPSAELAEKIENKITQNEVLGKEISQYFPLHTISKVKDIKWNKQPFIVQWAHSHTGDGTILVDSAKALKEIQAKFPEREARVSEFIKGPSFTVNVVVAPDTIEFSTPSFQITGKEPFTDNPFSTIGNDWSAALTLLTDAELQRMDAITTEVGEKLRELGWKGLFGADFIRDGERNHIYLIEINARQPASTTYESQLQKVIQDAGVAGLTTFEAHLRALRGENMGDDRIMRINDGAQILQRVTAKTKSVSRKAMDSLKAAGYNLISYDNTEMNADLLRIQSSKGIMENENKFNNRGKVIEDILK
jgi:predicted ATP-grasp superfamily ATP-dependent carboligase